MPLDEPNRPSSQSPLAPHTATAAELRDRLDVASRGAPFLVMRDGSGAQRIVELHDAGDQLTIGRRDDCDLVIDWDARVSRLHAQLVRVGGDWVMTDDGLSQNGSYVNDIRVGGRRRLRDGDLIRLGSTVLAFVAPRAVLDSTLLAEEHVVAAIPPAQRRVLVALCRPLRDGDPLAAPASNAEIAAELVISVDAVRTHLKALYRAFELQPVPQPNKRATLARKALLTGVVRTSDLD